MTDIGAAGPSGPKDTMKVNDMMPNAKSRRNSIFSAVRDLNQTAYPDINYKSNLMDEVRKWKWIAQNALEISVSQPNTSTPNTSTIQDTSIVSKMKSYADERPELEEFLSNNSHFFKTAASHSIKLNVINDKLSMVCDERDKLVLEISNDVRDDILLDC